MSAMDSQRTDLVDYAKPLLDIERLAKELHDLCLEHRYEEARYTALLINVEARMLQQTLFIMEEKEQRRADPQRVQAG